MTSSCYGAALRLIAARDLSIAELRQRLGRRGYPGPEIDAAVERLVRDRSLDDGRVAVGRARMLLGRGRGRRRVLRELEAGGIPRATAREAVPPVVRVAGAFRPAADYRMTREGVRA